MSTNDIIAARILSAVHGVPGCAGCLHVLVALVRLAGQKSKRQDPGSDSWRLGDWRLETVVVSVGNAGWSD